MQQLIGATRWLWSKGCLGKVVAGTLALALLGVLTTTCSVVGVATGVIPKLTPSPRPTTVEVAAAPTQAPAPTAAPTARPAPTATPGRAPGVMVRADLGDAWPLTVDAIRVRCMYGNEVVLDADGTVYALNGTAKARKQYADLAPIWRDDPTGVGLKMSLQPLVDVGLPLCR